MRDLEKIRPANPNFYKLALSDKVNQKTNPEGGPHVKASTLFLLDSYNPSIWCMDRRKRDASREHPKHNTTWKVTEPRSAILSVCGQEGKRHAKI